MSTEPTPPAPFAPCFGEARRVYRFPQGIVEIQSPAQASDRPGHTVVIGHNGHVHLVPNTWIHLEIVPVPAAPEVLAAPTEQPEVS